MKIHAVVPCGRASDRQDTDAVYEKYLALLKELLTMVLESDRKICPHCHGNGVIEHRQVQGNMTFVNQVQCNYCNGTGKIVTNTCPNCNGTGFIKEDKVFRLNIDDIKASTENGDYVLDLSGGHESKYSGGSLGQLVCR